MMKYILMFGALAAGLRLASQSYTSYFTGDVEDIVVQPTPGIVLAGGGGDNDNAMQWFLERANGGDVLVIRTSGADGYNSYLFSDLGVDVNSVETILFNNATASEDEYVITQIENAEAIFIAGGDQWNYVDYWKDSSVEVALNDHINIKQGVIGGTSAGSAIQGGHYFSAENGTVYSDEALDNPYNNYMTIGHQDFLQYNILENVITDTHYNDPDRRARHLAFLARIFADGYPQALGIGCNEYVAVCIDEFGMARAFGEYPDYDDWAYFLRHGCDEPWTPEVCAEDLPLTWNRNQNALYVFRMNADVNGSNSFDLNDWMTADGGNWQEWWVQDGVFNVNEVSDGPQCALDEVTHVETQTQKSSIKVFPNPCDALLNITSFHANTTVTIFDSMGVLVSGIDALDNGVIVSTAHWPAGVYSIQVGNIIERLVVIH